MSNVDTAMEEYLREVAPKPMATAQNDFEAMVRNRKPVDESKIPESDQQKIAEASKALEKLFDTSGRANFLIELRTIGAPSVHRPVKGGISYWINGRRKSDHGNDRAVYLCPGRYKGVNLCYAALPDNGHSNGTATCPKCGNTWKEGDLIGDTYGYMSLNAWADSLHRHIQDRLGGQADIKVICEFASVRDATALEQVQQKHGDLLKCVEDRRLVFRYNYERLAQDMRSGKTMADCIRSFLRSI